LASFFLPSTRTLLKCSLGSFASISLMEERKQKGN